jgi:F0F1-type ATP synthase assembly protein I
MRSDSKRIGMKLVLLVIAAILAIVGLAYLVDKYVNA